GAEDALSVWFRLLRRRLDLTQAVHLETAARECASLLGLVEVPVRQAALLQEMARHLAVPAPALERMLQKGRKARPAPERIESGGGPADHGAAPASPPLDRAARMRQQAEFELLACVLAKPSVLETTDVTGEAPLESEQVATLLAMATDGVAIGRTATDDLLKYLFARAAEEPELLAQLGAAHERTVKIAEPEAVLAGLMTGRRRLCGEPRRRALRQGLQQALLVGDQAAAAELQQLLLDRMREDRPRPDRSEPGPTASTKQPAPSSFPSAEAT
ncbi:MAG: hypothetical protein ABIP94_25235, partial [Planctomycetota bacterium]